MIGILALLGVITIFYVKAVKKSRAGQTLFWAVIMGVALSAACTNLESAEEQPKEETKQEAKAEPKEEPKEEAKEEPKEEVVEEEVVEEEVVEEPAALTPEEVLITKLVALIELGQVYDTGTYIPGEIPAGEYAFVPAGTGDQYFEESDLAGDIMANEIFSSFGYVYVQGTGNIKTDGTLINVDFFESLGVSGAKEIYEVVHGIDDYQGEAQYKIGVDIPAGQYTFESVADGYVEVMSGPVGKTDIVNNNIFNGKYMVNVSNGQYLKFNRASIVK